MNVAPRNDNLIYALGVVDDLDPVNSDGSPKTIDDMTVTWDVRTALYPGGDIVASGSGALVTTGPFAGGGNYYCQLDHDIDLLSEDNYYYHVEGVQPATGFKFTLDDAFANALRAGRTLST